MAELPDVLSAVTVQPGDVLAIIVPVTTTAQQAADLQAYIAEHWPQLVDRVMILGGGTQVAVVRDAK